MTLRLGPPYLAAAALLVAGGGVARAEVSDLPRFLREVEQAAAPGGGLRADGKLEVVSTERTFRADVVVLRRPPDDTFVEARPPSFKALILSGAGAFRLPAGAGKAETFAATDAFAGSDFVRADLEPFRVADYRDWRISDENADEITVTLFPKEPPYSQLVTTFDLRRKLSLKTLYYRDTLSNLVKMQTRDGYVRLGESWLPATRSMESFKLRTRSTLTLRWSESPSLPAELFDPASLPRDLPGVWVTPGL